MEELSKLLLTDIEERKELREGVKRIKTRQTYLSIIGVIIVLMFFISFLQTAIQIRKENIIINDLNEVIHVGKLVIESQNETIKSQDEVIDSLNVDYLPKK